MCSFVFKAFLGSVVCIFLFSGCEREAPSPVDIKIDEVTPDSHVVIENETLYDIAYRYGIDPVNLAEINGLHPPYALKNGQILQLPKENSWKNDNNIIKDDKSVGEYVAIDASDTLDSGLYNEEELKKSKKEIDEDFNSTVLSEVEGESSDSFSALSAPKVTATAIGTPIPKAVAKNEVKKADMPSASKINDTKLLSDTKMRMPVRGKIISHFGDVNDGVANDGINIKAERGTEVSAAADGNVIYVGDKLDEEYGNVVIIQHDNGLITSYAHLDKANVKKNAYVHIGDIIGSVGSTGDVNEPQLYFEVMKNKKPVNPSKYLKK